MLPKLNFPDYTFRLRKTTAGNLQVFDIIRKKFVELNPEEWVRQHVIWFLVHERGYPLSLFTVERGIKLNNTAKRTDILVYDTHKKPLLLVECKAPEIELKKSVLEQSLRYNLVHKASIVVITNGLKHIVTDMAGNNPGDIPFYNENHHKT